MHLTVIQHNVNSWNNKRHELCNTYKTLDPDIILINHTGLIGQEQLKIRYYTVYTSNKTDSRFRGTAIAIKDKISHSVIDDFSTDLLAINVDTPQGTITIGTDYLAPQTRYLDFPEYKTLMRRRNPVYLLGDLNARHSFLSHCDYNPVGDGLYTLITRDVIEHVGPSFPTRIVSNSSSTPDIVISNKATYHNILLTPGPSTTSDHIPIVAKITANPIQIPIKPRPHYARANWDRYKDDLENFTTPNLENATPDQIDQAASDWASKIKLASDTHIPLLKYRVVPGLNINTEIQATQDEMFEIYNLVRIHGPSTLYTDRYMRLRNKLREQCKASQYNTWEEIIRKIEMTEDPSSFWKSIKRFKGNQKQKMTYLRDDQNQPVHTHLGKERLFTRNTTKLYTENTYIEDEDLHFDEDNINFVNGTTTFAYLDPYTHADTNRLEISFPPITLEELKKLIRTRKQRCPGPTGITATHLKQLPENMIQILLDIFNKTMSLGHFPTPYKKSHTIFLPKPQKSQHKVENYRPITLLDTHAKLLDKIIGDRLKHQMTFARLHNPRQHGFTANRGTNTALATVYEMLANAKLNKDKVNLVLRDISKAFDKVWHMGLKYKILRLNIPVCLIKILNSYITNRHTSVRIEHHIGPPIPLGRGVPQGGCLSPTLYNLYVQDTPDPAHHSDHVMYADDTTQIITSSKAYLPTHTARAIENITNHERKWKIQTNLNKFKLISIFHRRENNVRIYDGDTALEHSKDGTVLGLKISQTGLKSHVTSRINKSRIHLTNLMKLRGLSTSNKLKIYKATLLPSLIYPTVPMNTISKTQFIRLQVIQNDAVRCITNTRRDDRITMRSKHRDLKLDPVNITIHKQAKKTWEKLKDTDQELYNSLVRDYSYNIPTFHFPSSRRVAEGRNPLPIYSSTR